MSLRALPDLERPIEAAEVRLFHAHEQPHRFLALPRHLRIATRPDGTLDFLLEVVRGESPAGLRPFATLDFRLVPHYSLEEAETLLRQDDPQASVAPVVPGSGWLQVRPLSDEQLFPPALRAPQQLAWNGLQEARVAALLPVETAQLLQEALAGGTLVMPATAAVQVTGIAPRAPLVVSFDPASLLAALVAEVGEPLIGREDALAFFNQPLSQLPLDVEGERVNAITSFAAAMVDRLFDRWGEPSLAPEDVQGAGSQAAGALPTRVRLPAQVPAGAFRWDLSQAVAVQRTFFYELDLLQAARQVVAAQGSAGIVRHTVVPAVQTGVLPVQIYANLPLHRSAVIRMGVVLRAPPHPPHRLHTIQKTLSLAAPADRTVAVLHLSPAEPPHFLVSTFALLGTETGLTRRQSEERGYDGNLVFLRQVDFPVDFVFVEMKPALAVLAKILVRCRWQTEAETGEQQMALGGEQLAGALTLPQGASGTLEIVAWALDGEEVLTLGPLPGEDIYLDLLSFPTYGAHAIEIECHFDGEDTALHAIELLPETASPEEAAVLSFTPAQSRREWHYFAPSPFVAGYRFRPFRSQGEPELWSDVQSPLEPLTVRVGAPPSRD